jgi:MscS family membrane protein
VIIIPNSKLAGSRVVNISAPDLRLRERMTIGVDYASDVEKVRKILLKILKTTSGVLSEPQPKVRIKEYGDFAIIFELDFWIGDISKRLDIRDEINTKIWKEFKKHRIKIPFPVRTVILKKGK